VLKCSVLRVVDPTTLSAGPYDRQRCGLWSVVSSLAEQFTRLSEQFVESEASRANTVHGWFR